MSSFSAASARSAGVPRASVPSSAPSASRREQKDLT